jgi:PAS domain S-box-containing protein
MEKTIQNNKQNSALNENLPTVLIVEDDAALNRLMHITLEREGFKTHQVTNGADALLAARTMRDGIILLDYCLPDMNATQIMTTLREEKIETPVIITTGNGDEKIAVEMMKMGARDYIVKEPNYFDKLPRIINNTFEKIASEKELASVEEALRKSEAKYRELYENMLDAFVMVDMEGAVIEFNQAYLIMVGYSAEEIRKLTYIDLTPEKWRQFEKEIVANQIVKRGYSDVYEKEYRRKDGSVFPIELRTVLLKDGAGKPAGMWAIIRDITEHKQAEEKQKKLEDQLRQSQKLEAIGQLSSGVAHDFNNMLGAIMGHAELLKRALNPGSPLLNHSDVIISSCLKAADLTRQLLSFARKAPFELQKIDLNAFVKQVAQLMERTIDRSVEIVVDIPVQSAFISGDKNQLENALLNIAINARDAMPEGGHISITSETVELNRIALPDGNLEVKEGLYVKVSMADTGTGMSKEIKERIFEPFFTTKDVGKGTGLGLASVYGCVKQHNGYIAVESREGVGTRFDLYFPIEESGQSEGQKREDRLLPGKGSLLVVDDEEVFREIMIDFFKPLGYTIHCCADGVEAIEYFRVNNSTIDVVILDMNMPKMNGVQCFKHLKEIKSGVRVIVSTGYGDNSEQDALQKEGVRMFVQKPYKAAELGEKIRELMGAGG